MLVRISDLRLREVVNTLDGKRLGVVSDIEFDPETGKVSAVIVPSPGRIFWIFGKDEDLVIPWNKIKRIGVDVILVEAIDNADASYVRYNQRGGSSRREIE